MGARQNRNDRRATPTSVHGRMRRFAKARPEILKRRETPVFYLANRCLRRSLVNCGNIEDSLVFGRSRLSIQPLLKPPAIRAAILALVKAAKGA